MAIKVSKRPKHSSKPAKRASRAVEHSRTTKKAEHRQQSLASNQVFPVAGVGASAGGLEAFTVFLKHLPAHSGMAFVLIPHLDPKQPSQLSSLLSKATTMPVLEVNADTMLEPDHVYVMGSRVRLSITDGQLRAEERETGRNLPIDYFLRSLAQTRSSRAIGIVLSGTAADGTLGLKAVKAEGGVTFAQEPSTSKFDGMPRSAIAAGVVDFVLPPEKIAKRLMQITQHPSYAALKSEEHEEEAQNTELDLNRIFQLLRGVNGNDFTHYKHTTIRRRIHRRMALRGSENLSDYVAYLQENPSEARALADDLLICVTSFFRDPEALEALATKTFPEMVKDRAPEDPIRIWVPGCATGEEAYSIAICLTEFLERSGANLPVRIFATDLSESAIEKARAGIYADSTLVEVSPERLKRFFVKVKDGYQIAKSIRAACVFAQQNITRDPPFYNLDLISCCNVLIYFGPVLQRKALLTFHYALKPGGILMLGPSESVGPLSQSFSPLSKKVRLYVNQPRQPLLNIPSAAAEPLAVREAATMPAGGVIREALNVHKIAERMLLARYAPAGVIVDDALNVVHVRGDTGPYLQLASGEPTYSLLKMAREGLVVGLRAALLRAKHKKAAVNEQARVKHNGQFKDVNLRVMPINDPSTTAPHFIVVFEDVAPPSAPDQGNGKEQQERTDKAKPVPPGARGARENARLKQELAATRDYLQSIIEEQEAATEELKSANEEAQASNEELETAKEELQSTNEELNTVNDELKTRNVTLVELTNDLSNVLTGINVPLVMVGADLHIRRFTPAMEPILNLIESDVGRSISDLKPNINVPDLPELLRSVVHGASPQAREIQGPNGGWFSLHTLPYKTENRIDGALLVLLDIDAVRRSRSFAEAVIETARQPLAVLTSDLKVRHVNRAFYEAFKVRRKETQGHFIGDLGNGQWKIPKLLEALKRILPEKGGFVGFRIEHDFDSIGHRTMVLNAREIRQETPFGGPAILLAIEDITERQRFEENLKGQIEQKTEALSSTQADLQALSRRLIATQEEERERIARELHDDLAQRTAVMDLELERLTPLLLPSAEGALSAVREHLAELSGALRKVSHQLHPGIIADLGLPAALNQLVQEFKNLGGDARYLGRNQTIPDLSVEQATNLYRIAQEALHNARKHAAGSPVSVVLAVKDRQLHLSIEDTGPGFNLHEVRKGHGLGLLSMQERARMLGANLTVRTKPGGGTRIAVAIRTAHR
ncbi:MAG TPA: chemotaxis protein CheB [Bryobacteraceae bacterium]|nr:chemotaxis protein CheB [Bryobacteraceae bacterium]